VSVPAGKTGGQSILRVADADRENVCNRFAENFPQTTGEQILAGEFLLCQGLRFAFDVKHPFRALEGAIMELRRYGDLDVCYPLPTSLLSHTAVILNH
jgi:hypothetical protein